MLLTMVPPPHVAVHSVHSCQLPQKAHDSLSHEIVCSWAPAQSTSGVPSLQARVLVWKPVPQVLEQSE